MATLNSLANGEMLHAKFIFDYESQAKILREACISFFDPMDCDNSVVEQKQKRDAKPGPKIATLSDSVFTTWFANSFANLQISHDSLLSRFQS
jgi:hypothetical protein